MSAAPFVQTAPVKTETVRAVFCLLRRYTESGMERARVVMLEETPANQIDFERIAPIMKAQTIVDWATIFDTIHRELHKRNTINLVGYYCPHWFFPTEAVANGASSLYLTMVWRPILVNQAFVAPIKAMLEVLDKDSDASRGRVIHAGITSDTSRELAEAAYTWLEEYLTTLRITPTIPLDDAEEDHFSLP